MFQQYGLSHLIGLFVTFSLIFFGFKIYYNLKPKSQKRFASWLGWFLLIQSPLFILYNLFFGDGFDPRGDLPLNLSNFLLILLGLNLVLEKQILLNLSFFLGTTAGLLSIFFPDLRKDFPDIGYSFFWISHAPFLLASWLKIPAKFKQINYMGVWQSSGFLLVYILIFTPINAYLSSNYGYLSVGGLNSLQNLLFKKELFSAPLFLAGVFVSCILAFHLVWGFFGLIKKVWLK